MPEEQRSQMFANAAARLPVGKSGEPQEIAQAVALCVTNRFNHWVGDRCRWWRAPRVKLG